MSTLRDGLVRQSAVPSLALPFENVVTATDSVADEPEAAVAVQTTAQSTQAEVWTEQNASTYRVIGRGLTQATVREAACFTIEALDADGRAVAIPSSDGFFVSIRKCAQSLRKISTP
jgi:hypothetical protein